MTALQLIAHHRPHRLTLLMRMKQPSIFPQGPQVFPRQFCIHMAASCHRPILNWLIMDKLMRTTFYAFLRYPTGLKCIGSVVCCPAARLFYCEVKPEWILKPFQRSRSPSFGLQFHGHKIFWMPSKMRVNLKGMSFLMGCTSAPSLSIASSTAGKNIFLTTFIHTNYGLTESIGLAVCIWA